MRKMSVFFIAMIIIAITNCSTPTVKYMSTKPILTGKNVKYELVNSSVASGNAVFYIFGFQIGDYKNYSTLLDAAQSKNSCDLAKNVQLNYARSEQAFIATESYSVVAECWKLTSGGK
ncbi:hypothetical protein [Leptospira kanakyensis]|uniref:TRL-like family protein n=1 Tax=Leptospira kanakyensis TaxID=2484968 RepID=A0A6N4Q5W6_9LEPT|nr:hypothetical protein [Leptospira kanakyensis]MCW7481219.1 hypothetical protein [Leptospira kanakyensis]TGK46144.1 hypothetical protein EHQ11_19565 [Leptospira kanakyensis]TGK65082.1 hypothetical protein EHQ16_00575 [Leptospira kanakyensis]TGK65513.1 hypothetical protein EHQ18_19785 [Leptospira kanakyensis]